MEHSKVIEKYDAIKLAYIGDAVYELFIREFLINKYKSKINDINKMAFSYANAHFQAEFLNEIYDLLSEDEKEIIKKARNKKVKHCPKNTTRKVYMMSTGFEALIGYLYIKKDEKRLYELLGKLDEKK